MASAGGGGRHSWKATLPTAAEVEYLAEFSQVEIIPNFHCDVLQFIGGPVGPLIPARPVEVPLWFAVTLRRRNKCTIKTPEWMSVANLTEKLDEEKSLDLTFAQMPEHFMEVSSILLESAPEDIEQVESVRQYLQDIQDVRYSKMRQGLVLIKESAAVKLNNISRLEINSVRPFFSQSMDVFFKLTEL